MGKKRDEINHQINRFETLIASKRKELENLELGLSMTHEHASKYTNVPAKIQLEIRDLNERIKQANAELENFEHEKEQWQTQGNLLVEEVPRPTLRPVQESINVTAVFLGGLLLALIIAAVWLDIQVFYPKLNRPIIYRQMLDPNFHHLGDNTYSVEYVNSISGDKIHNLSAEGLTYHTTFDLLSIRRAAKVSESTALKKAEIIIFVNALKPRNTAPVVVGVNGQFVTYLNDLVTREEFQRTMITILLDVPLYEGQNEIEIITSKDAEQSVVGMDEYEDFEFDSLALHVTFDATRLDLIPFLGLIVVELLLAGGVFVLLKRTL